MIIDYIYKVHYKLSIDHHPVYSDDVAIGEAFGEASRAFQSCVYGRLEVKLHMILEIDKRGPFNFIQGLYTSVRC